MGEFLAILMRVVTLVVPFIILYFIIVGGVKNGINQSEVGKYLKEKNDKKGK